MISDPRSTESRKQAYKRGLRAEMIARMLLRVKGYKVLKDRYKNAFGEIDIIAAKGNVVALVEVKARASISDCMESITPQKQARQIKAAKSLMAYPGDLASYVSQPDLVMRFDLICIVPWRLPHHIENAWQES